MYLSTLGLSEKHRETRSTKQSRARETGNGETKLDKNHFQKGSKSSNLKSLHNTKTKEENSCKKTHNNMEEVEEPSPPPPPPKKWSFPSSINLGSCIGGVPIKLHLTFFLLLLLELIGSFRYAGQFPLYILFVFVLYGPVLLITVLMHEFGHVWMTKRQGGEVGGIVLWVSWIRERTYILLPLFASYTHDMNLHSSSTYSSAPWWICSLWTHR